MVIVPIRICKEKVLVAWLPRFTIQSVTPGTLNTDKGRETPRSQPRYRYTTNSSSCGIDSCVSPDRICPSVCGETLDNFRISHISSIASQTNIRSMPGTDEADLQCSICLDFFYEPLTLQCNHTFCRVCLLQTTKLAPDGRSCPQCRATIENIIDPLNHPEDKSISEKVGSVVSQDSLAERKNQSKAQLEALAQRNAGAIPVFIMGGARNLRPGAPVNLFFFEPRYRVLIRRAWEGERRFLWADTVPTPSMPLDAMMVTVEEAQFLRDGRASVSGTAVERVTYDHSWIEEGTNGLWYASSHPPESSVTVATTPSTGVDVRASARARSRQGAVALPSSVVVQALEATISRGAPMYNRGNVRGCAELYLATARRLLEDELAEHIVRELQSAAERAEGLLMGNRRRQADQAAWVLRHAFDRILDTPRRASAPSRSTSAPAPTAVEARAELPVFFFSGLSLGVGARASFTLFEQRYLHMANECWAGDRMLLCASVERGASPSSGQTAVLARMQSCTSDEPRLQVVLVGVRRVTLGAVREDVEKDGLWYAQTEAQVAGSGRSCTIC